ncbi:MULTISPECIES: BREX-6 system phosphatase PglZ [Pseudanabaena]|uniref:PglZ domain protein n=2 Tax=Pseudanabaena TaxID=1152 RepID=L8N4R6_9CYAN|nr:MULTISPECIES: BREX-6 system phosphatase PglZ [Pseudanabaena]ELS34129.1 PglZ domain protein [Pseudanabaena biceps PCC 7429]MDG3493655.1 BREX-6 system phosphatase PglZ [Pseudanabaena catenata USMAC16]
MSAIASYLENDIKETIRRQGIVLWLDADSRYTEFVDRLITRHQTGDFDFPVVGFRGSYLEILLQLENYGNGLDPEPLLIHLPNHNTNTVKQTPLLELYRAGKRYEKALNTLVREAVTGKVAPDAIADLLKTPDLTLAGAETWLDQELNRHNSHNSKTGNIRSYLAGLDHQWILDGLLDHNSNLRTKIHSASELNILIEHLYIHTGMDITFLQFFLKDDPVDIDRLELAFVAWLMCVEYTNDLTRSPYLPQLQPLRSLPKPLQAQCQNLINHLRDRYPIRYMAISEEVEAKIKPEFDQISPNDLGKIDTFATEDRVMLNASIQALLTQNWQQASIWGRSRINAPSLWIQQDSQKRRLWGWVLIAAQFGQIIAQQNHVLNGVETLREALDIYTQKAWIVDYYHRRFEQLRLQMSNSNLPQFASMVTVTNFLRQLYRDWADDLARGFAKLCDQVGFLPEEELQQRYIFERYCLPLITTPEKDGAKRHPSLGQVEQGDRVAIFLVDAFRYEMAMELMNKLNKEDFQTNLIGCYAELPTITAMGMNAIAPVSSDGKIRLPDGKDFSKGIKAGEYTVKDPDSRARVIGDRTFSSSRDRHSLSSLSLQQVAQSTSETLGSLSKNAALLVIHSREIDDAGEANMGLIAFTTWIQQLKAAINNLQKIGIHTCILTADHGFMLLDHTVKEVEYATATRRYVRLDDYRREADCVSVPLRSLNYEGQEGYLLFRNDTAIFKGRTKLSNASFAHGGNSLQERVIPVLTVTKQSVTKRSSVKTKRVKSQTQIQDSLQDPSTITEAIAIDMVIIEPVASLSTSDRWQDNFDDPAIIKVFEHLEKHGAIVETELVQMLGSSRKARSFSLKFEEFVKQIPFGVQVENVASGKRYIKR